MADGGTEYKLIRAVDPTKIKVPIKSKFAKLTLSAKTKNMSSELGKVTEVKQNINQIESGTTTSVMEKIFKLPFESSSLSSLFENPLCRSVSELFGNKSEINWQEADTEQNTTTDNEEEEEEKQILTGTQGMEPLQVSDDGFTSQNNISSTIQTTVVNDTSLCITISDTLSDYKDVINEPEVAISGFDPDAVRNQTIKPSTPTYGILCEDKISRINAFLRDVSLERNDFMHHDRYIDHDLEIQRQLAQADTESMSQATGIMSQTPLVAPASTDFKLPRNGNVQDITKGLNLIEIDGESEVNRSIPESEDLNSNTSSPLVNKTRNSIIDESIIVPETSSEVEIFNSSQVSKSSKSSVSDDSSSERTRNGYKTDVVPLQLNSISISAKFNIKIHIADTITSSSSTCSNGTSDIDKGASGATNSETNDEQRESENINASQLQTPKLVVESDREQVVEISSDAEEENFISHAEDLLNQLYGSSWQTPNVIKTLKRSSGSANQNTMSASRVVRSKMITPPKKHTTKKSTAVKDESALGDFSTFRSKIVNANLDSTHLKTPSTLQPKNKRLDILRNENRFRGGTHTDSKNPNLQERWRQLIDDDTDSEDCADNISMTSRSSGSIASNEKEAIRSPLEGGKPDTLTPLANILRTCRSENKPKIVSIRKNDIKTKRKLFVPNTGYEDEKTAEEIINNIRSVSDDLLEDLENVYMPGTPVYKRVQDIKKQISGGSGGAKKSDSKPIFKLPTTMKTPVSKSSTTKTRLLDKFEQASGTPPKKYSFLKSLEECVSKSLADPRALMYRDNYRAKKDELTHELYTLFIKRLFNESFHVAVVWNKKLTTTAGRCLNKKRLGTRTSVIELSDKVLTSAERLRCTLIHELCHAATWILNEESGHGATWKGWAARANRTFPELPKIGVCHNYEIEYKYTYQCSQCLAKTNAHSKSRKVENIRCSICHGEIILLHNKKDKDGNMISTQVKEATGFAKYVKEHYKRFKRPDLNHADVMKILSNEFGNMKVSSSTK